MAFYQNKATMDPTNVVLIKDEDSDDELLCPPRATPAAPTSRQPYLQNGARFSGPGLPFDAIVSAANSSGIFNVGHTCNLAKRSGSSVMCRIECNRCDSRIILHLKEGLYWEVTQSGVCKKRAKRTAVCSPTRPSVSVECCQCYAEVVSTNSCCKDHIFCSQCAEGCFSMDVFTLFDKKFGGGGVNLKGAWCTKCVEDCDEKDDVGWVPLRFGTASLQMDYADMFYSAVASKESVVTQWRNFLQIAERRKDDLDKANAAHQLQQQQAWKRFLITAEELLCTRCPMCQTAFLFEDGCVALKCVADHPGLCWFCCYCDMVGAHIDSL